MSAFGGESRHALDIAVVSANGPTATLAVHCSTCLRRAVNAKRASPADFSPRRMARLSGLTDLSTPLKKCIGSPEQKYISDAGKKAPELAPFRQALGLGGIIRRRIRTGTA